MKEFLYREMMVWKYFAEILDSPDSGLQYFRPLLTNI